VHASSAILLLIRDVYLWPGFCFFPAALPADNQKQLMVDALSAFPTSPSMTNHFATLGLLPEGFWEATLQGLYLRLPNQEPADSLKPPPQSPSARRPHPSMSDQETSEPSAHALCPTTSLETSLDKPDLATLDLLPEALRAPPCGILPPSGDLAKTASPTPELSPDGVQASHVGPTCRRPSDGGGQELGSSSKPVCNACSVSGDGAQGCGDAHYTDADRSTNPCQAGVPPHHVTQPHWSHGCQGPSATDLLRKLRWATLGPPFNWTMRVYERDAPMRPLPPYLHDAAVRLATAARELSQQDSCTADGAAFKQPEPGDAAGPGGGSRPRARKSGQAPRVDSVRCTTQSDGHTFDSAEALCLEPDDGASAVPGLSREASQEQPVQENGSLAPVDEQRQGCGEEREDWKAFIPDAALVNYYRQVSPWFSSLRPKFLHLLWNFHIFPGISAHSL
jgi:hypothetical protein